MILNENFVEFIKLLDKYEVKYVLVGGWVVIFEGYSRTTNDIDFFIEMSDENSVKVLKAIKDFFGSTIGFVNQDFLTKDNVIMLGRPPFRIDILTSISGVTFEEAYNSSRFFQDEELDIRCIHINELIRNKKASGRLKDLADAEKLEKILQKRNKI